MAYRRTERVEARLADNRTGILHAARQLVSQRGWGETQIINVAAVAGLATGTVYRYFASKTELFVEVLAGVSEHEIAVMSDAATRAPSARAGLHAAVQTFVTRAMRNRRLAYALIAEPCEREIDVARLTYRHAVSQLILQLVRAGQAEGAFGRHIRADVAATVIVGGFMEALIGPLSPLTPEYGSNVERDAAAVGELAQEIADRCCACVDVDQAAAGTTLKPTRRRAA
jgi:AcrR family transcriptional regulator